MIEFQGVGVRYSGATTPTLRGVDLHVDEGELCLLVGRTGAGKSTLLRAVNGLVPHFTGGTLVGRVTVGGRDTRTHPPRELADLVGMVVQDPTSGFVADSVEQELAFGMECLGVPAAAMRRRVEDVLDLLGLAELRDRPLATLSGGQRQRVAIGAVLTANPRVLVLDEPTSALDPAAAEDVLAAVQRLVHDLGMTVLMAEHRLERVVQYADRIAVLDARGTVTVGAPARMMVHSPVAPPVVSLGRLAGWDPLPLSIRDARRAAGPLRDRLHDVAPTRTAPPVGQELLRVTALTARYGSASRAPAVLRDVSLSVRAGDVVALMGRNGSGKSTLLAHLAGLRRPASGTVRLLTPQEEPALATPALGRFVGLVPQDPGALLYETTVAAECEGAAVIAGIGARTILDELAPGIPDDQHPSDLSEGQRLALALAVVLAGRPRVVLLDEPTRGLDYEGKAWLVAVLRRLAGEGHAVVVATHDVELAAEASTRTVVLADGEVVADGPTEDVVLHSPAYAPQVTKILAPQPWLRYSDVARALAG